MMFWHFLACFSPKIQGLMTNFVISHLILAKNFPNYAGCCEKAENFFKSNFFSRAKNFEC